MAALASAVRVCFSYHPILKKLHRDYYRIADCGLRIADCGLRIATPTIFVLGDGGPGIGKEKGVTPAGFHLPQSAIRNPQSAIGNPSPPIGGMESGPVFPAG